MLVKLFAMELSESARGWQLRFTPVTGLFVLTSEVFALVLIHLVIGTSGAFAPLRPLLFALALAAPLINLAWVCWWQMVEFDRASDQVRRGPQRVGAVSAIAAIERQDSEQHARPAVPPAALRLVFREAGGELRCWSIPGVSPGQATSLGTELAQALGVPFRP